MLKKQKRYLYLNTEEISVVLQSLIRLKNTLIREGRYTDCVDELIVKVMEAPARKNQNYIIKTEIGRLF